MLEALFKPKSIAVIGASKNRNKVGNIILRNLLSTYSGKIIPINNNAEKVEGLNAYKSIKDVKDHVDLAIIAVPREEVPEVMEELGESNVKASIIITSGFRELDEKGAELENEIVSIAKKYGIRFLGPNTFGIITPSFNATFAFSDVKRGNIALVVQSGGIGVYMLNWAQRSRMGISYFVSLGNQADLKETDIIEYLANDPETKAIFSYIEGISDGQRFLDVLPEVTKIKPVVFLKGGVSTHGSAAAKTHTGSLAGSYEIFKAAVRAVGAILVEDLSDFLDLARLISSDEPVKNSVLVITNSGGHGVLTSDAIDKYGLTPIELPDNIIAELQKVLPPQTSPHNPLDLSGDATSSRYDSALNVVRDLDCTKVVIVQSLPMVSCTEVARVLLNYKGSGIVGVVMGLDEDEAIRLLESARIPVFRFPETAIKSISYISRKTIGQQKIRIPNPSKDVLEIVSGKKFLRDYEAFSLLERYNIQVAPWRIVTTEEEAEKASKDIGFPVVMKVSADTPIHKTEIGGVILNVDSVEKVKSVFSLLKSKAPRVLIQKQLSGAEVFVGGIKDQIFGHAVVVGAGGIYVEVFKAVSYGLAPVYEPEALQMIKESKVYDVLTGRGKKYNVDSLVELIVKTSRLLIDLDVKELDFNPVIVTEDNAYVVDARITFS